MCVKFTEIVLDLGDVILYCTYCGGPEHVPN